jgi:hypothetical protein
MVMLGLPWINSHLFFNFYQCTGFNKILDCMVKLHYLNLGNFTSYILDEASNTE